MNVSLPFYPNKIRHSNLLTNTDLDQSKYPATTPFYRTDVDCNEFKFVINSQPLFCNLPNPRNLTISAMSLEELKNTSNVSNLQFMKNCITN